MNRDDVAQYLRDLAASDNLEVPHDALILRAAADIVSTTTTLTSQFFCAVCQDKGGPSTLEPCDACGKYGPLPEEKIQKNDDG